MILIIEKLRFKNNNVSTFYLCTFLKTLTFKIQNRWKNKNSEFIEKLNFCGWRYFSFFSFPLFTFLSPWQLNFFINLTNFHFSEEKSRNFFCIEYFKEIQGLWLWPPIRLISAGLKPVLNHKDLKFNTRYLIRTYEYRIVTLSVLYPPVTGIITSSLKSIGQFKHAELIYKSYPLCKIWRT